MTLYTTTQVLHVLAELHHMTQCNDGRKRWFDPSNGTICDEGGGMYWDVVLDTNEWQKCPSCNSVEFERKKYEESLEIPLPKLAVILPLTANQDTFINTLRNSEKFKK